MHKWKHQGSQYSEWGNLSIGPDVIVFKDFQCVQVWVLPEHSKGICRKVTPRDREQMLILPKIFGAIKQDRIEAPNQHG